MSERLSRAETWKEWDEEIPTDDPDGWELTIFKEGHVDADFSNRTLPRTYMGRSLFERVSFRNTDLHGSHLCWNDFVDCDFSDAELSHADLRASIYRRCNFNNCYLVRADLRQALFEDCTFEGANLCAAKISRS
ncbi:pentapeptide repeat-containing protein [bacterium]|nr:MAG: pentapeptide repeat-containing protein [bacterium]